MTLAIVTLAFAGTIIWLVEILAIKGWHGLNWLKGSLYAPYFSTLLAVFAFITPFCFSSTLSKVKIVVSILILYIISIFCFKLGQTLSFSMYSRLFILNKYYPEYPFNIIGISLLLFPFLGFTYWIVSNLLLLKNKKTNIIFLTALIISSIPLSLLTIQLFTGFGTHKGWIDAVKMGYPIFWLTIGLGLAGMIIAKQEKLK